jgi:galactose mutarotase-like enzyme
MKYYSGRSHGCRCDEFWWRGHRLCVIENELLRISVLASKGADIIEFRYKPRDLDILWHAPQPVLPPGQWISSVARTEGSFLDYYVGGWQEIFPTAGGATRYAGTELGQHGEVALLPWDVSVRDDSEKRVSLEFTVETLRTPFRVVRRMILESGQAKLRLEGEATNLGVETLPFAWGQHPCFGRPFLEAGCRVVLPECDVFIPKEAEPLQRRYAVGGRTRFPWVVGQDGAQTRVDIVRPVADATEDLVAFHGFGERGACRLLSPSRDWHIRLGWDARAFPWLWSWQLYGGRRGYPYYGRAYAIGLEPFSVPPVSFEDHIRGEHQQLRREETTHSWFEVSVEVEGGDYQGPI